MDYHAPRLRGRGVTRRQAVCAAFISSIRGCHTHVQQRPPMPSAVTVAKLAAAVAWVWLVSHEALPAINHVTQGFASYYAASYAVLHGGAADLNNDAAFSVWLVRAGIHIGEIFQGNAPTLSLLMIPLTLFTPETAQTIWLVLNLVMLAVCVWLAGRLCAPDNRLARWWIAAIFPLLNPVRETIHWGQVYILLALLFLIAIVALARRNDVLAGTSIGLALLLKPYYGVLAFGLLMWRRRFRSSLAAAITVLVIVVVSLPLLAGAWTDFAHAELTANNEAWALIPANQTLNSLLQHLFVYSSDWNPAPLIDIPWLAIVLRWALIIGLVAITLKTSTGRDPLWLWLPVLILMPVLAPVGEPHHMMSLLLPVAVGVTCLVDYFHPSASTYHIGKAAMMLFGTALLFLIVPWPSVRDNSLWDSWRALFAYPRVYGALLLWWAIEC